MVFNTLIFCLFHPMPAQYKSAPHPRAAALGLQSGDCGRGDGGRADLLSRKRSGILHNSGRAMRIFSRLTYLIPVLTVALWPVAEARACSGCGCRGGSGYRGPNRRCVQV
jgi:hypothetical protein